MCLWTVVLVEFMHTGGVCVHAGGHSGVCVRVCLRDHQKKELEIYWGDRGASPCASPPLESGVFSASQPPVLKHRETHSGNGDNSAVIAGDL